VENSPSFTLSAQRDFQPFFPFIVFFLAIPFPPVLAKKFLITKAAPPIIQAFLKTSTVSPMVSPASSHFSIVLFNSLSLLFVCAGESWIPLFSIPILKEKLV